MWLGKTMIRPGSEKNMRAGQTNYFAYPKGATSPTPSAWPSRPSKWASHPLFLYILFGSLTLRIFLPESGCFETDTEILGAQCYCETSPWINRPVRLFLAHVSWIDHTFSVSWKSQTLTKAQWTRELTAFARLGLVEQQALTSFL